MPVNVPGTAQHGGARNSTLPEIIVAGHEAESLAVMTEP